MGNENIFAGEYQQFLCSVSDLDQLEVSWHREATPTFPARLRIIELGHTENLEINYLEVCKVFELRIPGKLRITGRITGF
jgi:hypothetical protein